MRNDFKEVHVLIPGNYECFTLWGKSDFAYMPIDFEIRRSSCINWVAPNIVITRVFVKEAEGQSQRRCDGGSRVREILRCFAAVFEEG